MSVAKVVLLDLYNFFILLVSYYSKAC